MNAKTTYPQANEPRRVRKQREALQRRAALDAAPLRPEPVEYVARLSPCGSLVMSAAAFRGFDFGLACQMLGLKPSRPRASAAKLAR